MIGLFQTAFRVKHSFFVHTLEDEILLQILEGIKHKVQLMLTVKSTRKGLISTVTCIPLKIFHSTRSGRRFLGGYVAKSKRFTCFRLDAIKEVSTLALAENYDVLSSKLNQNLSHLWGVSFQGNGTHHLHKLTMTLQIFEPKESYILNRLKREGRGGTISAIAPNTRSLLRKAASIRKEIYQWNFFQKSITATIRYCVISSINPSLYLYQRCVN